MQKGIFDGILFYKSFKMSLVVSGSLAYDHIMSFSDDFRNHIMLDKVHMMSVCFNVDDLSVEFGGTAGNIAYNLYLLGCKPFIVASVGKDFEKYRKRIEAWGMSMDGIHVFDDAYTAQAFITTDAEDNQITAFHGGAMYKAHEQPLSVVGADPSMVIISPNGVDAMVEYAEYCRQHSWSFWFDPGQAMNALSAEQLLSCVNGADGLIVNDYELEMFLRKTNYTLEMLLDKTAVVIETLGEKGVNIRVKEGIRSVSALAGVEVVDPTGAGDAFRAGLLYALEQGKDMVESCTFANAVASFAVEKKGTQNHYFTQADVQHRLERMEIGVGSLERGQRAVRSRE